MVDRNTARADLSFETPADFGIPECAHTMPKQTSAQ